MSKITSNKLCKYLIPGLLISTLLISGCGNQKTNVTKKKPKTVTTAEQPTSNKKTEDVKTITDANDWNSPVKNVLDNNNIKFIKVEIKDKGTYSTIYVQFPYDIDGDHKSNFRQIVKDIASANSFENYKIQDDKNAIYLEVTCDKSKKLVKDVQGGPEGYFDNLYPSQNNSTGSTGGSGNTSTSPNTNTNENMIDYVKKNVPEIGNLEKSLISKSNGTVKLSMYIERQPNPTSTNVYIRDYYGIYVGESHPDHNVNIYRFAVQKDTKEILYYDVVQDKYMTLDEWRSQNK